MASQELFKLEKDIALLLLNRLEHLQMTEERAGEIARFTLQALPENLTDEQVRKILPSLDDKFFELAEIVHKHLEEYKEAQKNNIIGEATHLIHQGRINEANKLMKNYFASKNI